MMSDDKSTAPTRSAPTAHATPAGVEEDELDIRGLVRMFWRRKAVIVATMIVAVAAAVLWTQQQERRFTATAELMLDPRERRVVQIEEVVGEMGTDQAAVQSEIEVLTSRSLAANVVDELQLTDDPAFNPGLRPDDGGSMLAWVPDVTRWLPPAVQAAVKDDRETGPPPSPEEKFAAAKAQAVNILLGKLSVRPLQSSRVLELSVESGDPKKAARLANAYADIYIEEQLEAKYQATERATEWLNGKVQDLKQKVQAAEQAVAKYKKEAGLVQSGKTTVTSQQLSELNSELILAQTKRAEKEARLNQIQRLIDRGGINEAAKVLDSSLIDKLRSQRAELNRQLAELSTEYGSKHPRMVNLRAEIEDVNEQIQAEVQKILQNVRNEVEVARTRERTLQDKVQRLENQTASLNTKEVQLRQLEREAEANRALYQRFLSRLKETTAQEGIQKPDARIISEAAVPSVPSYPNSRNTVLAATMLSLMAGVGFAFLLEKLDNAYRSAEQTEAALGLPNLALVPLLKGRKKRNRPSEQVKERPQSAFAEAIRSLHTGILLSDVDDPPKIVAVTSALPREGKTSISVALARSAALSGNRVLLVDADLRQQRLHAELGVEPGHGLVELLSGDGVRSDLVRRDELSGAHYLLAGGRVPSPQELLASNRMKAFLAEMRGHYDLVVLDTPPVLAVSDTLLISRLADRTVFAIGWAVSRRENVQEGVKKLRDAGAQLAGTTLSMVDVRKHAKYSYTDSGYYYGRYASYYAD